MVTSRPNPLVERTPAALTVVRRLRPTRSAVACSADTIPYRSHSFTMFWRRLVNRKLNPPRPETNLPAFLRHLTRVFNPTSFVISPVKVLVAVVLTFTCRILENIILKSWRTKKQGKNFMLKVIITTFSNFHLFGVTNWRSYKIKIAGKVTVNLILNKYQVNL